MLAQVAQSPPAASYQVTGIVKDAGGDPVNNVEITLLTGGVPHQVTASGADGRFSLGEFSAGKATLQLRRLGYEELSLNITVGADSKPTYVEVLLKELPQKLEEVMVKSDEQGRLRDFSEHKRAMSNFGHYFDRSDIRKRNPSFASELLRSIPGVQVQASAFGGNTVRVRGCQPLVWVDGQRAAGAELDDVVRPSEIAGIEFYASNAGIPPEYMDRQNAACGIIVVWTKSR